jgi:hypothetical protein
LPYCDDEWTWYGNIRDEKENTPDMFCLECLWRTYQDYNADPHFQREMQESSEKFNQRFWEMYLGCMLLKQGLTLKKSSRKGPDICIQHSEHSVWVEAVAPERGDKDKPSSVLEMEYEELRFDPETGEPLPLTGRGYTPDERTIKLRYLGAIGDKSNKVQKYINDRIISPADPVIIAVNSANIPEDHNNGMIAPVKKACFGLGDYKIDYGPNRATNIIETLRAGYENASTVIKFSIESGSEIDIESDIFLQKRYPHISAIIFSHARLVVSHESFAG